MIHPKVGKVFEGIGGLDEFSSWLYERVHDRDGLTEFVRWHLETVREVIAEIRTTQGTDLEDPTEAGRWARGFLHGYDAKIRGMRRTSGRVFDRFHTLREEEFERVMPAGGRGRADMVAFMESFLDRKGLLIGKIIFSYREMWFLAKGIEDPGFRVGTVKGYRGWVDSNISDIAGLEESLETVASAGARAERKG